ncbi:uncharacterized protein LOC116430405 [Nomia melanderi]|uniref:uncharacterized protein LOC116430405 n=1 Tax=Nomia melanderi TaxID=2448451 RepID=UPI0013043498|nr:CAP-Gly domain-containing linker protein 1-like [Nomia melanderi]
MDSDIEQIHNILLDAHLPSSINDLKNPTEEYVVNLINTFLRRFYIDVDTIDKPTKEQQVVMSYLEDTDIIRLINLHTAMGQICDRIYIKDLSITDIISPGSKRIRKQAKFLSNFVLYATTKESEIEDTINEMKARAEISQDMLEKKNELTGAIKEKESYIRKQLSLKDKYNAEIQKIQLKHAKNKEISMKQMAEMTIAEEYKQQTDEVFESYKKETSNLSKTIAELQSEIVKSPEKYNARLKNLEEQQNAKIKQRDIMREAFQDKKNLFEQLKTVLGFIQKQLDKFNEVKDVDELLKKVSAQGDNIKKQVEILRADIKEFEQRLETQKDKGKESEIDDFRMQYKERLTSFRNMNSQLLREKENYEQKFKEEQIQHNEDCLKLKKMQSVIKKLEEETSVLIKNYQDIYDNEISNEKALWEDAIK